MVLVMAVLTWVLASVTLVALWIGYRTLVGTPRSTRSTAQRQRDPSEAITT